MGSKAQDDNSLRQQVFNFITKNRTASLATVSEDGIPHVVILYCLVKPDLSIYFMTRVEGRKFGNIMKRPTVSMAFYNEHDLTTVQLTGKAVRIKDLREEQEILYNLVRLAHQGQDVSPPPIKLFERGATNELAIVKVAPQELTYATFKPLPHGRYQPLFQKLI